MSKNNSNEYSRRNLLELGAGLATGTAVAGCLNPSGSGSGPEPVSPSEEEDDLPLDDEENSNEEDEDEITGLIWTDVIDSHLEGRNSRLDTSVTDIEDFNDIYDLMLSEFEGRHEDSVSDFGSSFEAADTVFSATMDEIGSRTDYHHSGLSGRGGAIAEKILSEVYDFNEGHISHSWAPGHGRVNLLDPTGFYLIDSTTSESGRKGEDPLSHRWDRNQGRDKIYEFDPDWFESEGHEATRWQKTSNALSGVMSGHESSRLLGFRTDLVEPIVNLLDNQSSSDMELVLDKIAPASMTAAYIANQPHYGEKKVEFDRDNEYIVILPDSLEDLPSLSEYGIDNVYSPDVDASKESQREYIEDLDEHYEIVDIPTATELTAHPDLH